MAQYPTNIPTLREVENDDAVVYDADATKVVFAEDINKIAEEIVALATTLGTSPQNAFANVSARIQNAYNWGVQGSNKADAAQADVNKFKNLTTAETIIGTWVDNKPLYRKHFKATRLGHNSFLDPSIPATAVVRSIEATTLVESTGALYSTNGTFYVATTGWFSVNWRLEDRRILFREGGSDFCTVEGFIYYTKTTD